MSAIVSGTALLVTGGLGMPLAFLAGSVFASFTWPAVILVAVVGGTQALATVLLLRRKEAALLWAAVAGFGMLIWIFVEISLIHESSWLQVIYFSTGSAQVALVLALLGIVEWLPRRPLHANPTSKTAPVSQAG
ncbi:hypothetical protein SAMN05216219_1159 [Mycetocola miduiensis]|uniref:Uncharacterized protein n=1 Tax=Mycetocola miduiensis TaxID=995034 RepID=A0A1I4ZXS6_9MICO|nr:hypothetical protein SAMN05216219_1159 [Mycetocola miduiensis]